MTFFQDILAKLGWDDGFQVPVANEDNAALERELAELTLRKVKVKNNLDNVNERLKNLAEHSKFVSHETEQTQKLIVAYKQQFDSEEHQFDTVKAEKSKTEQDIIQLCKRIADSEKSQEIKRTDLKKALVKVDKIKSETSWDIEALESWEESLKKRDEDNEMIKKFSKEDERKFNDLEAKRQQLQIESDQKAAAVKKLVCDLHSCEMIIERTGKAIKQQLNEREALIVQWKDAIKMLQQRDADIAAEQQRIIDAQDELTKVQERLDEEGQFLETNKKNNKELEMEISNLNYTHCRYRREAEQITQKLHLQENKNHLLKRSIAAAAVALENLRIKSKQLSQAVTNKEKQIEAQKKSIMDLENKQREMSGTNATSNEQIERIQKMITAIEDQCKFFKADTDKLNSSIYRLDIALKEFRDAGMIIESRINNVSCIDAKLKNHIRDEEKDLERLKEVVYNMQYRIDEFEQKLCKLEGLSKQDDQLDEKEEKIKELEKEVNDYMEVQNTLQAQVSRLQNEMLKVSNFIQNDRLRFQDMQDKVENHILVYDIGKKQVNAAKQACQEKQVEENIMKLRINHIENDLETENKKIYSLQKLRLGLDQIMKERQIEIEAKKQVVLTKKRVLDEDVGRLKSDINLKKVKIEHLQKKYHIELMSLGKDDDGQALSLTHFKIKHAQEKFFLQQEGDELDTKIKTAEKEIIAMENTLKVVNLTNITFKKNLTQVKDDDKEIVEMRTLQTELKESIVKLKQGKEELETKKEELNKLKEELGQLEKLKAELKEKEASLQEENLLIEKQERLKQEKLERAQNQMKKAQKKVGARDSSVYFQDLEIRHLKDTNKTVTKKLYSMCETHPDMAPNINKYATEQDIALEPSTSGSEVSSIFSSVSSDSSVKFKVAPVRVKKINLKF